VLLVGLLGLPISLAAAYLASRGPVASSGIFLVAAMGYFVFGFSLILVATRLLPIFPARAIQNNAVTVREMWAATSGNSWRLFWGCFLTIIPPLSVLQILFGRRILSNLSPSPGGGLHLTDEAIREMAFFQGAGVAYALLASLIFFGFLSFAYQHFLFRSDVDGANLADGS
jgi:hypothetical protein